MSTRLITAHSPILRIVLTVLLLSLLCACDNSSSANTDSNAEIISVPDKIIVENHLENQNGAETIIEGDSNVPNDNVPNEESSNQQEESLIHEDALIEQQEASSEAQDSSPDQLEASSEAQETSEQKQDVTSNENTEQASSETAQTAEASNDLPPIIWLGDSLTQGSLGDDNGNVNNPQAPWRIVANYGVNITGYGYYGYNTHDILWRYGEDGGKKISSNIYIFWVGSNDFVQSPTGINDTIGEINRFVAAGNITKYIVIGTTDRAELGHDKAVAINETFKNTYGSKYLDILKYVEYGPDGTHLTVNSYSKIGSAVYNKIINMYKK